MSPQVVPIGSEMPGPAATNIVPIGGEMSSLPVLRSSTADPGVRASADEQLKRTDVPDRIRAELEAIRNGTAPATGQSNVGSMIGAWRQAGPQRVVAGVRAIADSVTGHELDAAPTRKPVPWKGINDVVVGSGVTAMPMVAPEVLPAIVAAPGAAALTVGGATAAQAVVPPLARAAGVSPDAADLAGTVAGIGAGAGIAKLGVPALAKWSTNNKAAAMGDAYQQSTRDTMAALGVNEADVHRARPFMEVQHNTIAPIVGKDASGGAVDQFHTGADLASKEIDNHVDTVIAQFPNVKIAPVNRAVTARVAKMPDATRADLVAAKAVIAERGLDQPMLLADAKAKVVRLNSQNRTILESAPGMKARTAVLDNPAYVARQEAANQLRAGIFDALEQQGVQGVRELRLAQGSILKLRNASDPLTRGLRSESTVARTGKTTLTARLAQKGLTLGGAGVGAWAGGPVGAAAGAEIGTELGSGLTTKNLSKNALLERAFSQSFTSPPAMTTQGFRMPQVGVWPRGQSTPPGAGGAGGPAAPVLPGAGGAQLPAGGPVAFTEGEVLPGRPAAPQPAQVPLSALSPSNVRGALPAAPDTSGVRGVPAAAISYNVDTGVAGKKAITTAQFSSDVHAAPAKLVTPQVKHMLGRMLESFQELAPQKGGLIRSEGSAVKDIYAYGAPGTGMADDFRVVSGKHAGNGKIMDAIQDMIDGKAVTNKAHSAVLDMARNYLAGTKGYHPPEIPWFSSRASQIPGTTKSMLKLSEFLPKNADEHALVEALAKSVRERR